MKTPEEELLEAQLARCAEALNGCLDGVARARERRWGDTRLIELRDATRLMDSSARLAGALARMRAQSRMADKKDQAENRGSNGQADRQT